jgi:hypothetical protein
MDISQIEAVRSTTTIAGIITTRNALYNLVGADGTTATARYQLVAWDDDKQLLSIRHIGKMNAEQPGFITYINYAIIDEIMTLDV